jgi:hypothetical protein
MMRTQREPVPSGPCPLCEGERWVCEQHPERPFPHEDCDGPGDPCPACNPDAELPPGWVSIARVDDDD